MIEELIHVMAYPFMQKALITGIFIAVACSLLGVFLYHKRLSLIGDGLSHISFGGISAGLFFNISPFFSSLIFAVIGSFAIIRLNAKKKLESDASIAIISYVSLGLGVFITSAVRGFNVDLMSYLFGSILSISLFETIFSMFLSFIVIVLVSLFYWEFFYITFDEESAKVSGIKTEAFNSLLILLTAITVVASMRVVGLLLVSSLMVIPAVSSKLVSKKFKDSLFFSVSFSVFSVIFGLFFSYFFNFATSGTIVLVNFIIFVICYLISKLRDKNE